MRESYDFLRLASRLANPFGHPSQVRTQVLVLQTCVDLRRLASPFGQGFIVLHWKCVWFSNGNISVLSVGTHAKRALLEMGLNVASRSAIYLTK